MKVLHGEGYIEARLYGIIAEMFYSIYGRLAKENDVTTQLTGTVVTNATTEEVGYLIDPNSQYFNLLPEVHANRLVDVVEGDGWMDNTEE
jgi:hypothetical protein